MASINPLHIPSILSHVMDYITSVEDVKNVHQVSKYFYAESLRQWRKTKRLVLHGLPNKHPGILTRDFLELLRDSDSEGYVDHHQIIKNPFRDYSIRNEPSLCSFQTGNQSDLHLNSLFWDKLGVHMETLKLFNSCILPQQNFPSGLQWILLKAYQNVKELYINYPRTINEGTSNIPMVLDNGNFHRSTAPHLKVLCLRLFHYSFFSSNFEENLEMGKNLFNMMPHLSSLQLDASTQSLIAALPYSLQSTGTFIQLESLDLDFTRTHYIQGQPFDPFSILSQYIDAAKPPLKHLKLKFNLFDGPFPIGIPRTLFNLCANTLEKLDLILNKDRIPFFSHSQANFSELVGIHFPNLTHLFVDFYGHHKPFGQGESIYFDFRSLLNMPSLQEFLYMGGLTTEDAKELGDKHVDPRKQLEEDFKGKFEEISENPLNNLEIDESLPQQFSFTDLSVLRKWIPVIKKLKRFVIKA